MYKEYQSSLLLAPYIDKYRGAKGNRRNILYRGA